MKAEFDRVASRQPMDTLSMKRYELPTPPAGKMTDVAAWNECVDNSMAQLEHQRTRITNLELMSEFGCESWKVRNIYVRRTSHSYTCLRCFNDAYIMFEFNSFFKVYNEILTNMAEKAQKQLKDLKKEVQEVNWARKNQQGQVGDRMKQLESHWVGLVSKNYEIEQALAKMETEIAALPAGEEYFKTKREREGSMNGSDMSTDTINDT